MYYRNSLLFTMLLIVVLLSCENTKSDSALKTAQSALDSIKSQFIPDKRVALFDVEPVPGKESIIIKGETDQDKALFALKEALTSKGIIYTDSVALLPATTLGDSTQAVVTVSVANLRSNPAHAAEMATQATLGTPIKILKKEGGWFYIQTPDQYLSWVNQGQIQLMNKKDFARWKKADKIIYTSTSGHAFSDMAGQHRVSDLVAGDIIEVREVLDLHYKVVFPDGREAYIPKTEAMYYDDWLKMLNPSEDALVETAQTLMGVPYLWGGTSTKGVDCSGFTKTIYFLNGIVIPRDASQQVHAGKPVDSSANFQQLQRGDLLFFGRKATDSTAERVVHVGMWIGDNQFIHSSDRVRISSMDEKDMNYDAYNKNRYLRTKRMLNQDLGLIELNRTPLFKD